MFGVQARRRVSDSYVKVLSKTAEIDKKQQKITVSYWFFDAEIKNQSDF